MIEIVVSDLKINGKRNEVFLSIINSSLCCREPEKPRKMEKDYDSQADGGKISISVMTSRQQLLSSSEKEES
ncbi:MAG: hypothetical protein LUF92_04960 [Clostridiales bacterium]|nr:hypothetical protein [Clostridiales bacterium]